MTDSPTASDTASVADAPLARGDAITPTDYAVAAFSYYLEHYNNGRPFIPAGHSQGSAVTQAILKYYMAEHPDVYERMVAAYVIGYFVTEQELRDYPHHTYAPGTPPALFPRGVFHMQDYGFYYYDTRANAAERSKAYLTQ